jgi:hypothetical protein
MGAKTNQGNDIDIVTLARPPTYQNTAPRTKSHTLKAPDKNSKVEKLIARWVKGSD